MKMLSKREKRNTTDLFIPDSDIKIYDQLLRMKSTAKP